MRRGSTSLIFPNTGRAALGRDGRRLHFSSSIVTAREPPLEKAIQNDEQIPRTHFLDPKLRDAGLAVGPLVRDDGIGVPAHDRLERQLDRQIEVMAEEWPYPVDHGSTIELERIGDVVVSKAKEDSNECIRQAVQEQFV